ncbi:CHAT domain-containing protein [Actinacidiphila glaucinigra]|uniref:CHAT domain-containing protein n=1 Tax=Actinacidiphila glaucinigra TaxID=235986 RepID=A0A239BYS0_9ACTN|nr:CHAT domain-containing protein [Actinacidiphila glaucinigra]SNS13056.1 CHAT domain-containing protein [Actinacidiphila glaucinigra]
MTDARAAVDRMLTRFGLAETPGTARLVDGAGTTPGSLLEAAEGLLRESWRGGDGRAPAAAALALMVLGLDTAARDDPSRARLVLHLQLADRTLAQVHGDFRTAPEVRHHLGAQTQHRPPDDLVAVAAVYPSGPAQQPFRPADPLEGRVAELLATLPPEDLSRPGLLARLAHSALVRYECGATEELPALWARAREAFEAVTPGHVDAPDAGRVAVLAGVARVRAHPRDREAVDVAVRGGRLALAAASGRTMGGLRDRHEMRSVHFALAVALMCTLPWAPARATIDEAMGHLEAYRAEGLPDEDGAYEVNAASLLAARAVVTWEVADAAEAERMLRALLERLPPGHPLLPHIAEKAAAVGELRGRMRLLPRALGSVATRFLPMMVRFAPALPPVRLRTPLPRGGVLTGPAPPPEPVPEPVPEAVPEPEAAPGPEPGDDAGDDLLTRFASAFPVPPDLQPLLRAVAKGPGTPQGIDPAFLADAERRLRGALERTEAGSPERAQTAGLLMALIAMRYTADQDAAVIEEAAALGDRVLAELPHGSPEHARLLLTSAPWQHMRAVLAMDAAALRACCAELRAALDLLPDDAPERAAGEAEYANALTNLAGLTQDPVLSAEARRRIADASRRVERTPGLTDLLGGMVASYGHWADYTDATVRGDGRAARAAEVAFAAEPGGEMPALRFEVARIAMADALEHHDWAAAADAAARALETLPSVASRALTREDRRAFVGGALLGRRYAMAHLRTDGGDPAEAGRPDPLTGTSLGRTGCAAALAAGRPAQALALLEQGRAVLMGQDLEARADLTALSAAHPLLAREFSALAGRLRRAEAGEDFMERHVAAAEWEALLMRVRGTAGFERFLMPPTEREMRDVAAQGPVVAVNVDRLRCDAVVVTRERIFSVPLRELTEGQLALRAQEFLAAVSLPRNAPEEEHDRARELVLDTLAWLWRTVAEPVLTALGLTRPLPADAPASAAPRLWWSASGPLAYLPLHAAGLQRKHQLPDGRSVLDRVASSYTPTLRALRHARQVSSGRTGGRLLAVGRPTGTAGSAGASAREIAAIADALGGVRALEGEAATPERVLAALRTARWVHFACHGVSDPRDPSASRLLLHGGPLSAGDVSRQELLYAELAVLLACHTAHTGQLPDEAVHLASAFQTAGYPQVVGALWEADDAVSALLAARLYAALRAPAPGAVAPADAGRALNHVARALRTRYARSPAVWAPFVHIGR